MKQYKSILKELEMNGIPIHSSRYDDHAMGSWFIETSSTPPYRIVHDGRDKTIVLEVFENEWNSMLADKTKSGKHVISKLMHELRRS